MPVVVGDLEVQRFAELVRLAWAHLYQIGLYRNDYSPSHGSTAGNFLPANFSGYVGLRDLSGWNPPTWDGRWATIKGPMVEWAHDGGPMQCEVFGYYVLTNAGQFAWAERIEPPVWVTAAAPPVRVIPRRAFRSEF